jgi:glycine/D-amino acid oxidase-like deaminating enzyme
MRIAIIGAGSVGGTLGRAWLKHGEDVVQCRRSRIRKENTDEGYVAFHVRAEIPEGVGMATLDDGISLRREGTHSGVPSERERMRQVPASGTRSQSGRCASSYSIS